MRLIMHLHKIIKISRKMIWEKLYQQLEMDSEEENIQKYRLDNPLTREVNFGTLSTIFNSSPQPLKREEPSVMNAALLLGTLCLCAIQADSFLIICIFLSVVFFLKIQ